MRYELRDRWGDRPIAESGPSAERVEADSHHDEVLGRLRDGVAIRTEPSLPDLGQHLGGDRLPVSKSAGDVVCLRLVLVVRGAPFQPAFGVVTVEDLTEGK